MYFGFDPLSEFLLLTAKAFLTEPDSSGPQSLFHLFPSPPLHSLSSGRPSLAMALSLSRQNKGLGEKGQDRGLGLEPPEIAKTGWHRLVEAKVFQQGLLHRVLGADCGLSTV